MSFDVELEGMDQVQKRLASMHERVHNAVVQAIIIGSAIIEEASKNYLKINNSIVTGNLFQSVGTTLTHDEEQVVALVGSALYYAWPYQFGMTVDQGDFDTPAFAEAILTWAAIKGFPEAAGAIVDHIRKYGTKPHPFIVEAFNENKQQVYAIIKKATEHEAQNDTRN